MAIAYVGQQIIIIASARHGKANGIECTHQTDADETKTERRQTYCGAAGKMVKSIGGRQGVIVN